MTIERKCKTCEHRFGLSWHEPLPDPCRKCPSPEHPQHRLDRGLLEARVAELEAERAAAIARAAEERAARSGLEEQLSEAERRRDELRAQVARLRDELGVLLTVIDGNRSSHHGIEANRKFRESVARLSALLGEAKEGGGA